MTYRKHGKMADVNPISNYTKCELTKHFNKKAEIGRMN